MPARAKSKSKTTKKPDPAPKPKAGPKAKSIPACRDCVYLDTRGPTLTCAANPPTPVFVPMSGGVVSYRPMVEVDDRCRLFELLS